MTIKTTDYPLIVEPLSAKEGGGFVAIVPDLPGCCMSDGETPEEAVASARDAILAWIEAAQDLGHAVQALTAPCARRLTGTAETRRLRFATA